VITVLGVAYKGNVDDTRETPALKFIKLAKNEGYEVRINDPHVSQFEYEIMDLEKALEGSDCIVIITDHEKFKEIAPEQVADLVRNRNIVDTRNILKSEKWMAEGFNVDVLGDGCKHIKSHIPISVAFQSSENPMSLKSKL